MSNVTKLSTVKAERGMKADAPRASKVVPSTIYVVIDDLGLPTFSATWPEACHEHIRDAQEHDVYAGHWVVREYGVKP